MAKAPAPGQTKTRLCPPLSAEESAALYQCFLLDKFDQMKQVDAVDRAIAYWPASGRAYFSDIAPGFRLLRQEGRDLSERLKNVVRWAFRQGYDQAMAIDGDTPTLPFRYLSEGFIRLSAQGNDVVLGPTTDGGYYAIGMRESHPSLFDVTMSTPSVLDDTLARAEAANLHVSLLPEWRDVDHPSDLAWLAGELRELSVQHASSTARFLSLFQLDRFGEHSLAQPDSL